MQNTSGNFTLLRTYQKLQYSIMFDELVELGFATVGYSKTDASVFWNNALTNQSLNEKQINDIERTLASVNRKSTVYFEHRNDLIKLTHVLESKGYHKSFEDCWQFWSNRTIDERYFNSVKEVITREELRIFLGVFDACYQKDDPQNPYGELGNYVKVTEDVWSKHHSTNRLQYFLVYRNGMPVAVSTLTNFGGMGYISNVGSLRKVRGEGFGKAATHYCVKESLKNGNEECCLATEEGQYPNEFYKRIGFVPRFTAVGFTLLTPPCR